MLFNELKSFYFTYSFVFLWTDWYATINSMELSDYAPSGVWTLVDAPAEIRIMQLNESPYENRSEMVFYMSKYS